MSAYIVEDKIINTVISYLALTRTEEYTRKIILDETGCDLATEDGRVALGKAMFDLNCNAVEQRYGAGEAKEFRDLDYAFSLELRCPALQTYKHLTCWQYQCSEGDIPEASLLFATMNRVKAEIADNIIRKLPGYDKAAW